MPVLTLKADTTASARMLDADGNEVPAYRHTNPDGSIGGWIGATSNVGAACWIDARAVVLPGATLPANSIIEGPQIIEP